MNPGARVVSAATIAVLLALAALPGSAVENGDPAAGGRNLWESVRAGAFGALDYGFQVVRSLTGWLVGGGTDDVQTEDIRGLLSLSDKEFRDFDALVRASGFALQGYSFGVNGSSNVEMAFDFERVIPDRERTELRRQAEQQSGSAGAVRLTVVKALLDAARYVDASPASGYRLAGVTIRLSTPPDVRIRFRRIKP